MGYPRATGPVMFTYMSVSPKTKQKFSNKEEPIKMLLSHFRLIVDAEAAWLKHGTNWTAMMGKRRVERAVARASSDFCQDTFKV